MHDAILTGSLRGSAAAMLLARGHRSRSRARARESGYVVLLGARNPTTGVEAANSLTNEQLDLRFIELNVTRTATISAAADRIEAHFGKLEVNNAGIIRMMGCRLSECRRVERAANEFSGRSGDGTSRAAAVEEVRSRPDRERLERAWVDYEAWRSNMAVPQVKMLGDCASKRCYCIPVVCTPGGETACESFLSSRPAA